MMNSFASVIGENGLTSNKLMNGFFLEQEALRGCGNSQVSNVLVSPLLKSPSFLKIQIYPHFVEILEL